MVRPKVCCLVVFLFEVLAYTSMIGCLGQAGRRGMEGMEGIGEAGQVSRFLGRIQVDKNQVPVEETTGCRLAFFWLGTHLFGFLVGHFARFWCSL